MRSFWGGWRRSRGGAGYCDETGCECGLLVLLLRVLSFPTCPMRILRKWCRLSRTVRFPLAM